MSSLSMLSSALNLVCNTDFNDVLFTGLQRTAPVLGSFLLLHTLSVLYFTGQLEIFSRRRSGGGGGGLHVVRIIGIY